VDKIVCKTLSQKNPSHKRAHGVAQGVGLEFKPQYHKKNDNLNLHMIKYQTQIRPDLREGRREMREREREKC
jgi:hypothetical protein